MNRKFGLIIIGLLLIMLFIACDPTTTGPGDTAGSAPTSLETIKGGWDFADQGGMTNIAVGIFPSDASGTSGSADIDWQQDAIAFSCTGNGGSYTDGVLSGTYDKYQEDVNDSSINDTVTDLTIQITFTLTDENVLTFSCTGEGPLAGKTFANGTHIPE